MITTKRITPITEVTTMQIIHRSCLVRGEKWKGEREGEGEGEGEREGEGEGEGERGGYRDGQITHEIIMAL